MRLPGLLTVGCATVTSNETEVRRCFRVLRDVRDRAAQAPQGDALAELSIGMSGDDEWAIEEGATIVWVGQAVFGPRPLPDSHCWLGAAGTRQGGVSGRCRGDAGAGRSGGASAHAGQDHPGDAAARRHL